LLYLFEHDYLLLFGTCGDTAQQKDYIRAAPLCLLSRVCGVVVCAKTRALHDFDDHHQHPSPPPRLQHRPVGGKVSGPSPL